MQGLLLFHFSNDETFTLFSPAERQQNVSHTEVKSLMDSLSSAVSNLRDKLTEDSSRSPSYFLRSIARSRHGDITGESRVAVNTNYKCCSC